MNMLHKTGLTNLLFEEMGELSQSEEEYWTDRGGASSAGYTPDSKGAAAYSSGLKDPSQYSKQSSADFSSMDDDAITLHIKNEFKQWVQTEFEDCGIPGLFASDMEPEVKNMTCPPGQQFALLVDAYALMSKRPQEIFKGLNQTQTNAAKAALAEIRNEINVKIKAGQYCWNYHNRVFLGCSMDGDLQMSYM